MTIHADAREDAASIGRALAGLRGDRAEPPTATIVVPVNAGADLRNILHLILDLGRYRGASCFEVFLVINNYPPDTPPAAIEYLRASGAKVEAVPSVKRRTGEVIGLTARMLGVRAAAAEHVILFDADCRVPDPTALLDWYVDRFNAGVDLAYSPVGYHDVRPGWSVRARIWIHYGSRWVKRVLLRVPTARGSNYSVRRETMVRLYEAGVLADDLHIGPAVRWARGRIAYSGDRRHTVTTSGRMLYGGWRALARYLRYRLRYNIRSLPVRTDAAQRTGRGQDPVGRYDYDNRP